MPQLERLVLLWPFGKRAEVVTPPISQKFNLTEAERLDQRAECLALLEGDLTPDKWHSFVRGMARFYNGTQYHDEGFFAQTPQTAAGDRWYFQTTRTGTVIKKKDPLGMEEISWGKTHSGKVNGQPTLTVIRGVKVETSVISTTVTPENTKPKKSEVCGNLRVKDYEVDPEETKRFCTSFLAEQTAQ